MFFVVLGAALASEDAESTEKLCLNAGFTDALLCPACDELERDLAGAPHVNEIVADCRRCCRAPPTDEIYDSGVLQVPSLVMPGLPQIEAFIRERAPRYEPGRVQVVVRMGVLPRLRMMRGVEAGATEHVESWKTDELDAYLAQHLRRYRAAVDDGSAK